MKITFLSIERGLTMDYLLLQQNGVPQFRCLESTFIGVEGDMV